MDINQLVSQNQSIKIVPSIEESLQTLGLNVNLDDQTKLWLWQLKNTWKTWKKSATVEEHLQNFFQNSVCPFDKALVLVINCEDAKDCKQKTLPYFIIETLQKWSKNNGTVPPDSVKLPAFHIATHQRNQQFLNLILRTYEVSTLKDVIIPMVRDMINRDNCKLASQVVMAMEMSDDIPVEDLLFPLVLQDKTNTVDEYLTGCSSQIKPFVLYLDRLLDREFNLREHVQQYIEEHNLTHIKYDKIHSKPLSKLVARLCNKFDIPINTCKNLSKKRTTSGLRYLIYQKYIERNVSSSVWDDLVKVSLEQNADAAPEFIDMLIDHDRNEALKWASFVKMAESELPLALKQMSLEEQTEETENWDVETNVQEYYKFPFVDNQIVIIDTTEKFYDLTVSTLVKCPVVSIDCEWKPSFGAVQSQVALIQIGTLDNVYLIDTLLLNKKEYTSFWCTFNKSFLDNAEIIKIGFGLEQDLKEIKQSVSGLSNIKLKGEGLLDLCSLWKTLVGCGLILPGGSTNDGNSLSALVQICFGLPLEKSEQCSNWELRPLRETQIKYAALDAHVLLQIYYCLQKLCMEQNIPFDDICNDVMLDKKMKITKKVKVCEKTNENSKPSNLAKDTRLLLDPILSPLLSYLRYCGIHTELTSNSMQWHEVVNYAMSDNYFIIVNKFKCSPFASFPQSSILDVGKGSTEEQIIKIFNYFRIEIREHDLFSICINCNSKKWKNLNPDEVSTLCDNYIQSTRVNHAPDEYECEDDDYANYDNFLSDSEGDEEIHYNNKNNLPVRNQLCITSSGVPIDISDVNKLALSHKPAILCEHCGKLYWDEDHLLKSIKQSVISLINVRFN